MNSDGVDRTVISWRAWYTDGRVYDSLTTTWEDLPESGLLIVRVYFRTRPHTRTMAGRSLYWKEELPDGAVYCYDEANDAIISETAWRTNAVKKGKWVTDSEMAEVRLLAQNAIEAPNESERIDMIPNA